MRHVALSVILVADYWNKSCAEEQAILDKRITLLKLTLSQTKNKFVYLSQLLFSNFITEILIFYHPIIAVILEDRLSNFPMDTSVVVP